MRAIRESAPSCDVRRARAPYASFQVPFTVPVSYAGSLENSFTVRKIFECRFRIPIQSLYEVAIRSLRSASTDEALRESGRIAIGNESYSRTMNYYGWRGCGFKFCLMKFMNRNSRGAIMQLTANSSGLIAGGTRSVTRGRTTHLMCVPQEAKHRRAQRVAPMAEASVASNKHD